MRANCKDLGMQKLINQLQRIEIEEKDREIKSLEKVVHQLKKTIQNQDETISEILDELEENEDEIYNLKSLAEGQSKALIHKDKYAEQLEKCILNQREEIEELEKKLDVKDKEVKNLNLEVYYLKHICFLMEELSDSYGYSDKLEIDIKRLEDEFNKYKSEVDSSFYSNFGQTPLYDSQGKVRGMLDKSNNYIPVNYINEEI